MIFYAKRLAGGFTFIELIITTSILAVISALAVPSLSSLLADVRIGNKTNELHTALVMARNHATINQHVVIVCRASNRDLNECASEYPSNVNWQHGWLIYEDQNRNNHLDKSDQLLHVFRNQDIAVVFNQRGRLRFFPDGSARSAGFYICSARSKRMRHLYLLYSGRSRVDDNLSEKQRAICKNHS